MTRSLLLEREGRLLGVQDPRVCNAPPRVSSAGSEAVDLAASAGLILDPWQAFSLEVMLGENDDLTWAAFEFAELVARQNGKGGILEARSLAGLFLLGERLMLHSAHEFKTSKEAYLRIKSLIEGAPHLLREIRQFRQSNEDTSVELKSGARLRFMARSRSTGRGFSAQTLLVDEAQILSSAAMGALMPTLSAQENPQIIYTGTVPRPEDNSEHFTSLRDRGRRGGDESLAWLEWNAGEAVPDLDDPDAWAAANPVLGFRIGEEFIRKERASLTDEDFARERLSVWPDSSSIIGEIDLKQWALLNHLEDDRPNPVAYAIEVSPDRSWSSIGLAGRRADGNVHIQIVQSGKGTGWVAERVADLANTWNPLAVALDPAGPTGSLIPALEALGVTVTSLSGREVAQACAALLDAVVNSTVRHSAQPLLNVAVRAGGKQPRGDAWVWRSNEPDTDIAPLKAVTLAHYALARAKTKPSGVVRWG